MPFIKIRDGGSWSTYTKAFVKNSGAWTAVRRIWMVIDSAWRVIWPVAGPEPLTDPYIADTSASTTPIDNNPVRRIGNMVSGTYNAQDLFGKNGTWDANGYSISSYSYRVRLADNFEGTSNPSTKLSGTYSAPVQITLDKDYDRKYMWFEITANTTTAGVTGQADSSNSYDPIYIIKRQPINLTKTISYSSLAVGQQLTAAFTWNSNDAYLDDSARRTIKWYKNTLNDATDGSRTEITSASGSYTYTVQSSDVGNYIIAEETRFNSGTDYDLGSTVGVKATVITVGQVPANITASGFANSDITPTPTPSSVSVGMSGTTNVGLISWTNASTISSVSVSWSGVATGSATGLSSTTTSRTFTVTTSGSVTATVSNTRTLKRARFQWNQTGAASYKINVSSSTLGPLELTGDSTSSSVTSDHDIATNAGTLTWTSLDLYPQAGLSGTPVNFPVTLTSFTPVNKTGSAQGTGNVTYTAPPTLDTPTFGTVTRAVGGFSVSISNYSSSNTYTVSTNSGSVSRSGSTITVTGLSNGSSATVSVVASRTGYTNSATGTVTGTAVAVPGAPTSLSRGLTGGLTKSFSWSAPTSDGGSSITRYEYSVDGGSSYVSNSTSTSRSYTYSAGGSVSFRVRAVNAAGAGSAAVLTFTIPTLSAGPTASSIGNTTATIGWTSLNQSSYSFSISPSISGSPFSGTTATSRSISGLTAGSTYTVSLTIKSSTNDEFSNSGTFSTTGGNVAPSGGTYTFSPTAPTTSSALTLTITNVSGTPATFTYSFVWARATTTGGASGSSKTYGTAVKTTTDSSSNSDTLSLTSAYNNYWVRVQTTVKNGTTPNLTSTQYIYVTDAV